MNGNFILSVCHLIWSKLSNRVWTALKCGADFHVTVRMVRDNFDTPLSFPPAPSSGQNDNLSNHFFYDLISETPLTFPSASVELWSCTLCFGWSTLASVGMQICSTKMGNMESIISDAAVSIRALSFATFPLYCTAQLNWLDMLSAQVNLFDFVYHCSWYFFSVGRIISLFIVMLGKIAFISFNTTQTYRNNGR